MNRSVSGPHWRGRTGRMFIIASLVSLLLFPNLLAANLDASSVYPRNAWENFPPETSILLQSEDAHLNFPPVDGFSFEQLDLYSIYTLVRQVSPYGTIDYLRGQPDQKIHAASLTQLMTYYVSERYFASRQVPRDRKLVILTEDLAKAEANQATISGLMPGDEVSITDLYYAMFLGSGAEAVYTLVRESAGSEKAFVYMMNVVAEELGMSNTFFTNPVGFSDDEGYTTLDDLAKLLALLAQDEDFRTLAGTRQYTISNLQSQPEGLALTHIMERYAEDRQLDTSPLSGGKTGSTTQSGYCFASFRVEGSSVYLVLTAKARQAGQEIADHLKLLRKMSEIPYTYPLLAKGSLLASLPVRFDGKVRRDWGLQPLYAEEAYSATLPLLNDLASLSLSLELPEELTVPLTSGDEIGKYSVLAKEENGPVLLEEVAIHLPAQLVVPQDYASGTSPASASTKTQATSGESVTPAPSVTAATSSADDEASTGQLAKILSIFAILLVLLVILLVLFVVVRRRQAARRRAKLNRLRKLQNSYGYHAPGSRDAETILAQSRQKREEQKRLDSKRAARPNGDRGSSR